jgi:hypothetical protein
MLALPPPIDNFAPGDNRVSTVEDSDGFPVGMSFIILECMKCWKVNMIKNDIYICAYCKEFMFE